MYQLAVLITRPYPMLLLALGLGVAMQWRRGVTPKWLRIWITVSYLLLLIVSLPPSSYLALGSLEWWYPPGAPAAEDVRVMVVLSGSILPPNEARPKAILGVDSLYRSLHAAELIRSHNFEAVVLSGGKVDPRQEGPSLAEAMRDFLVEHGVPADLLVVESKSRTTYENAVETSRWLRERGVARILLVTDAASLLRAEGCFARQSIAVVPSGCRYRASSLDWEIETLVPSTGAVEGVAEAIHEWLGIAWYGMKGRIRWSLTE